MKPLALLAALALSGCSSSNLLEKSDGSPAIGLVAGNAQVIGGELLLGPYRPGIALTFRYVAPADAVVLEEWEEPYRHPVK